MSTPNPEQRKPPAAGGPRGGELKKTGTEDHTRAPKEIRSALFRFGFVETTAGHFIALSMVGRIKPDPTKGTAICLDPHGNTLAVIHWPTLAGES